MGIKEKLVDLLERAKEMDEAFINSLTEAEREAQGTFEDWSAKDLLGHITAWRERQANRMHVILRDEQPDSVPDLEHQNRSYYDEVQSHSLAEIRAATNQALTQIRAGIQAMPEDDLTNRQRYSWLNGGALWRQIVGNVYMHPSIHFSEHYTKLGQPEKGLQLQEQAFEALNGFDDAPDWQGTLIYNLACYCAINGHREKALNYLRRSFDMNPGLVEFSKQDNDLVSLRDDPEYLALFVSAG